MKPGSKHKPETLALMAASCAEIRNGKTRFDRDRDMWPLFDEGLKNNQVAHRLGLSKSNVSNCRGRWRAARAGHVTHADQTVHA